MRQPWFVRLFVAFSMTAILLPAQSAQRAVKDKYHAVQIDRFEIQPEVEFPPDYLLTLQEEIIKQIQKTQKFDEVLRPGESPKESSAPVLRMTGTITHFKAGNRAKRYMLPGAGSTEIFAHVAFLDRATGEIVTTAEVRGIMAGGFIGGESMNVTRDFAKKVVNTVTLHLGKSVTEPLDSGAPPPAAASPAVAEPTPAVLDRHVVTIASDDFAGGQQKLNAEAANGYRLAGFSATGSKTADVAMEKSAAAPQAFEYRILYVRYIPNLQKDLNKGAEDGFRLCPHTLAMLGSKVTVITEKSPVAASKHYEYRVHNTMRLSSAEKDIRKDQSEGYALLETYDMGSFHVVVLEKAVEKGST